MDCPAPPTCARSPPNCSSANQAGSAAVGGDRDDGDRFRVQGCGGAISSLGAGRVSRRADAERGFHRVRFEGGELFHFRKGHDGGVWRMPEEAGRWRHYAAGWVPVLAIARGAFDGARESGGHRAEQCEALLAYSAIAHAGYMLLGLLAHNQQGMRSLVYYAVTYGLTVVGAFGVVAVVEERAGDAQDRRILPD